MANLSEWKSKAERASKALAKLRTHVDSAVVHGRNDAESILAGTLAGGIRGAFEGGGKDYVIPLPGGMTLPPEFAAGGLLLALAFSDQTGATQDLHMMGAGVLAFGGGFQAYDYMRSRKGKAAAAAAPPAAA